MVQTMKKENVLIFMVTPTKQTAREQYLVEQLLECANRSTEDEDKYWIDPRRNPNRKQQTTKKEESIDSDWTIPFGFQREEGGAYDVPFT